MGWPTIPPALSGSDHVTIRRAGSWTQDASGGRVRNLGPASAPVPCSISPVKMLRNLDAPVDFRQSMVARYIVTFMGANPNLYINDELTWVEEGKILTVVLTETSGSPDSRMWSAMVEDRPAK